jgi:hypothetical protein
MFVGLLAMYVLRLPKSGENMSESNRLPCDSPRRLLPDLVSVEKRNGICLLTDFFPLSAPQHAMDVSC